MTISLQRVWSIFRTIFMIQNLMYLNRPYTAEGNTFHTTCGEASLTIDITLSPFIPVDKDYLLVVQFEKKYFLFL